MRKVSQLVAEEVKNQPLVEIGLASGIINLTGLARVLKPKIENRNLKKTSVGAIAMALQRLGQQLKRKRLLVSRLPKVSDITVRSQLTEFTFWNNSKSIDFHEKIYTLVSREKSNSFFNLIQGVFETTVVVSDNLKTPVKKILPRNARMINNLSAVTVRFDEETLHLPGVYYQILKAIAWEGLNFIEVLSVSNELSLIFENSKVDKAFTIIKNLVDKN